MDDVVDGFFLEWAFRRNINGCNTDPLDLLESVIQPAGSEDSPLGLHPKRNADIYVYRLKPVFIVDDGGSSSCLGWVQLTRMFAIPPGGRSLPTPTATESHIVGWVQQLIKVEVSPLPALGGDHEV